MAKLAEIETAREFLESIEEPLAADTKSALKQAALKALGSEDPIVWTVYSRLKYKRQEWNLSKINAIEKEIVGLCRKKRIPAPQVVDEIAHGNKVMVFTDSHLEMLDDVIAAH